MKKFLAVIILLAALGGVYYFTQHKGTTVKVNTPSSTTKPDPSNATFTIEDTSVVFAGGHGTDVDLTDIRDYGDLNADGKVDTAVVMLGQGGGSGAFIYVAAYISGPVSYKGTNAIFVGDRVDPQSISIANGVITLKYLDRGPNEPLAADPTIPKTRQFVITQGELVEK